MSARNDETWLFVAEWFDPMPRLKRVYLLKFFVQQNQVEMVDVKSKKLFLKKSPCPPEVSKEDFAVGRKIILFSRELEIVDYGDGITREKLQYQSQPSLLILTSEIYSHWGKIIDELSQQFIINNLKSVIFPQDLATSVCQTLSENSRRGDVLSKSVSLSILLAGEDGVNSLVSSMSSFESKYGSSGYFVCRNGIQVSELQSLLFENPRLPNSSTLDSCTCCVIKPHAVKAHQVGRILDVIIQQGYEVSAIATINFDRTSAEEFLEVYQGVVPDFGDHVSQLCLGPSVAIELRAEDAVSTFRITAGPWDVQMAKDLRPDSLRALFAESNIRNAIHCTDLPTDGVLECEYCFRIL